MIDKCPSYLAYKNQDPFPFYARLHAEDPVHWDEQMNAWLISRFEDCSHVMRREDIFGHPYHGLKGAAEVQGGLRTILMLQGDEHAAMHLYLHKFFSKPVLAKYRTGIIRPLVDRHLDRFIAAGGGDLSRNFAHVVPTEVIAVMLGIPIEDEVLLEQSRLWNDHVMRWSETFGEDEAVLATALASSVKLNEVLLPIIRDREKRPRNDYISRLWADGPAIIQPWTETEVLAQCRVLFFAGTETTAHGLNNALYLWLTRSDISGRMGIQDVPKLVEEMLRFYGVIHFRIRVALKDVELGGKLIRAGDRVHPLNSAAGRDGKRFPRPDEVNLGRRSPRQHLAFNVGPRTCVGAELARVEMIEAIGQVIQRIPNAQLDPSKDKPAMRGHMPRSFSPLHLKLNLAIAT